MEKKAIEDKTINKDNGFTIKLKSYDAHREEKLPTKCISLTIFYYIFQVSFVQNI